MRPIAQQIITHINERKCISEDCFYYCSERNNVVVLFGTLKVKSFILTEVSDCGLLIVVTSSTFLKRKDMLKEQAVSPRSHPAS